MRHSLHRVRVYNVWRAEIRSQRAVLFMFCRIQYVRKTVVGYANQNMAGVGCELHCDDTPFGPEGETNGQAPDEVLMVATGLTPFTV